MLNHDTYNIDEYLTGRMKGKKLISFEKRLQNDADLQTALQERKGLLTAIDALGDIRMKNRVRRIHEQAARPAQIRQLSRWMIAAAAIVALAIGSSLWLWLQPTSNIDLYAQYYEPYAIPFGTRDVNADRLLAEAGRCYENKKYKEAIPIFVELKSRNINNQDGICLAIGISYIESNETDKALLYFLELIDKKNSPYYEQGLWYAALVMLKQENNNAAKEYLRQLTEDENSFYHDRAKELFSKIKM